MLMTFSTKYEELPNKHEFVGRQVWVRGPAKVMYHLIFGLLALTADQLLRLLR